MWPLLLSHSSLQLDKSKDEDLEKSDLWAITIFHSFEEDITYSRHCRAARCSSKLDSRSLQICLCNQLKYTSEHFLFFKQVPAKSTHKLRRIHLALCLGSGRRYIEELRMRSLHRCPWTHHMRRTGNTCACMLILDHKLFWTMTIADLSAPPIPPAHPCDSGSYQIRGPIKFAIFLFQECN